MTGQRIDYDLAADIVELNAFFAESGQAFTNDLVNAAEIGADEEYADVDEEIRTREEVVSGAAERIAERSRFLGPAYPFSLDDEGDVLDFDCDGTSLGKGAYLLSLILSHLSAVLPVLEGSSVYPEPGEIDRLRRYFQYFATAALAAEVRGRAWSFGFPRPDRSGFISKLKDIWAELRDGSVEPQTGAPASPKDDQIDVFAARPHADRLSGFLLAAAQVATGAGWKGKGIRSHLERTFNGRWFAPQPATQAMCYQIIPFARDDEEFVDDVRVLGDVLHRLRMPLRVHEALELIDADVDIEAFDFLHEATRWVADYRARAGSVA